jgi:hypothetical protein
MVDAWIAGDCWLKPGVAPIDLRFISAGLSPSLLVVNLECAVPSGNPRSDRRSLLPLDPCRLRELAVANKTVCVMANNHVTDYGPEGLRATLEAVREAGFLSVGAGTTLDEARHPLILDLNGRRVGLMAYADTRSHVGAVAATEDSPGVAPLDLALITEDIRVVTQTVHHAWVFLHWGEEYLRYPEPEQRAVAEQFIRAGATLIVGTHPHVVRGCEQFLQKTVYYSLGNFIFPEVTLLDGSVLHWDDTNVEGIVLRGESGKGGWRWKHLPITVDDEGHPRAPHPDHRRRILAKIETLSAILDDEYAERYPAIRRRELIYHKARRVRMMTWSERLRLPSRIIRSAWSRWREQN